MNDNKEPYFEGIKKELTAIGADFKEERGTISAILPEGTTIAMIPSKTKGRRFTMEQWSDVHYFQRGIIIVFPKRHNYTIRGICGFQTTLSPK